MKPTFAAFVALLNNYIAATGQSEVITEEERAENIQFLNVIMDTAVMQYVHQVFDLHSSCIHPPSFLSVSRSLSPLSSSLVSAGDEENQGDVSRPVHRRAARVMVFSLFAKEAKRLERLRTRVSRRGYRQRRQERSRRYCSPLFLPLNHREV